MSWITPITDRTLSDVLQKKSKGYFNYNDLNRIELNCKYLSEQLNGFGYKVTITVKTDWTEQDFPTQSEVDRIRKSIDSLIECYAKKQGSPDILFRDTLDFNDANSLEQNLENIDVLLQRMVQGFRRCGGFNFYSGSEVILP